MNDPEQSTQNQTNSFKPAFLTIVMYAIFLGLIAAAEAWSPSGSCTPGLGLMLLLLLPIVSLVLFLISISAVIKGRRTQIIPAIIHSLVLIVFGYLSLKGSI
jgi:hypothetical protein